MNLYNPYKIILIGGSSGHFAVRSPRPQGPRDPRPLSGIARALYVGDNGARTEALATKLQEMGFTEEVSLHASFRRTEGKYPSEIEAVEKALQLARRRGPEHRDLSQLVADAVPPDMGFVKRLQQEYGFPANVSFNACMDPRDFGYPTFEEAFGKAIYLNEKYQAAEAERLAAEHAVEAERQAAEATEAVRQAQVLEARRRAAEAAEARIIALSGNQ